MNSTENDTFEVPMFTIPTVKKEINFKNVGEAMELIQNHRDKDSKEICRLLRNSSLDWTEEDVKDAIASTGTGYDYPYDDLTSFANVAMGNIQAGAKIVADCEDPLKWEFIKSSAAFDLWMEAHSEQEKKQNEKMKDQDYFLVCTRTLDGVTAKNILLRGGIRQDHIIECETDVWEALDGPATTELVDLRLMGESVHGLGLEGRSPEGCDDLVNINMGGRWVRNQDTTATEVVAKILDEKLRASEVVAVAYMRNAESAVDVTQSLNISDREKFFMYHKVASQNAELESLSSEQARLMIEREDSRALAFFSDAEPILVDAKRRVLAEKYERGVEWFETNGVKVSIPNFQISEAEQGDYMIVPIDREYTYKTPDGERDVCPRETLVEWLKRDREIDMEENRKSGEEAKKKEADNFSIKFGKI